MMALDERANHIGWRYFTAPQGGDTSMEQRRQPEAPRRAKEQGQGPDRDRSEACVRSKAWKVCTPYCRLEVN